MTPTCAWSVRGGAEGVAELTEGDELAEEWAVPFSELPMDLEE